MNSVVVDELVKALAVLARERSTHISGVKHMSPVVDGPFTVDQIDALTTFLFDILSEREVESVDLRTHEQLGDDWYEFVPDRHEIYIIHRTAQRLHTLTIRQRAEHAQGGDPYGRQ
jgi:hypothetical protein